MLSLTWLISKVTSRLALIKGTISNLSTTSSKLMFDETAVLLLVRLLTVLVGTATRRPEVMRAFLLLAV